jgi:hypothetical protein
MTPELAVQKAIRQRLIAVNALTALVPANNILDRNQRPVPTPSIILGEAQAVDEGADLARRRVRVWHTLHAWTREPGLAQVAAIAGAIRAALHGRRDVFILDPEFHCIDVRVADLRTMRDPDGETGHAVVTVEVLLT